MAVSGKEIHIPVKRGQKFLKFSVGHMQRNFEAHRKRCLDDGHPLGGCDRRGSHSSRRKDEPGKAHGADEVAEVRPEPVLDELGQSGLALRDGASESGGVACEELSTADKHHQEAKGKAEGAHDDLLQSDISGGHNSGNSTPDLRIDHPQIRELIRNPST